MTLGLLERLEASLAVQRALLEDLGGAGDLTTQAVVPTGRECRATLLAHAPGVMAGAPVVELVFGALGARLAWEWFVPEGAPFGPGTVLGATSGPAAAILTGERVALNFLQRLCGIATLVRRFAAELEGTGVMLLDTRKTTPGLRRLERYAVRAGGGTNHRMGLYDRVLIKDNHLALAGSASHAVRLAREAYPTVPIEVEVATLAQFEDACTAHPDWILLDNMTTDDLRACVAMRDRLPPPTPRLEASGGVRVDNVRQIALTGVDAISVGSLTHGATWVDISLEVEP